MKRLTITFLFLSLCVISSGCGMKTIEPEQSYTERSEFHAYMMRLKERIESMWKYPSEAAKRGIHGDAYIKFTIRKNGLLTDVQVMKASGYNELDEAAIQALKDAEPYWPLPDNWGKDQFIITGHFVYSIPNSMSNKPHSLDIPTVSGTEVP